MAAQVRVRLCSTVTVETGDRTLTGRDLGSRKARTLLALLASQRGRLVPLDQVVEALWPQGAPADPGANVATLVSRSRRLLGPALTAQGRAYGLTEACTTDLAEAASLNGEAHDRIAAREAALAAAAARRSLDLLGTSRALPDEDDADWVHAVRREAEDLRREARHVLAEATATDVPAESVAIAAAAVAEDPYDERAVRDLMRGHVADGSPAAALAAYDALASRLREDLGTDPDASTSRMHLAILREKAPPEEQATRRPAQHSPRLVGREDELAVADRLWAQAGAGTGALLVVEGEPGMGKTRLLDAVADLAESSGGVVVRARCHPAERSLFLQPYVDALRPVLLEQSPGALAGLLRDHSAAWVLMIPELAEIIDSTPDPPAAPEVERRRSYEAVAAALRRLARRRPILLAIDDLQETGAATVDLLGFLVGRLSSARVLLVGAVRSEDRTTLDRLADRATQLHVGLLPASAVHALASAAGLSSRAQEVLARTSGHSLSVVEYLRALAAGDEGVPESLTAAVQVRVGRLPALEQDLVQGGAVLGGRLDPRTLADLVGTDELSAVQGCEDLARSGMFRRVGVHYEFANDLVQEGLYGALAPALVAAYHRRAADLLSSQPESMAVHAFAAGDLDRAAHGWLIAGRAAMSRSAVEDAVELFVRALAAAEDPTVRARILLARARAGEALTNYADALADIDEALDLARTSPDRRLELAALRARGGDVPVALDLPMPAWIGHLESGLRLASSLGDRGAEADFTTRLTVIESSRLRLASALARADAGLARARASASREALVFALDGVKTALGYLGDTERLPGVVAELAPELRRRRSTWLLQWTIFESSFIPAARGAWGEARALVEETLEVNRRSGFTAYAGYFRAHLGWYARLAGDLESADRHGRAALAETSPVDHPWWYATAAGILAGTLVEAGALGEAATVAGRGLAATTPETAAAWRLRCVAPLAVAGDGRVAEAAYDEARSLLSSIECPPGRAWVPGSDCYLLVARAALGRGDDAGAVVALRPLREAVSASWGAVHFQVEEQLAQISSASS